MDSVSAKRLKWRGMCTATRETSSRGDGEQKGRQAKPTERQAQRAPEGATGDKHGTQSYEGAEGTASAKIREKRPRGRRAQGAPGKANRGQAQRTPERAANDKLGTQRHGEAEGTASGKRNVKEPRGRRAQGAPGKAYRVASTMDAGRSNKRQAWNTAPRRSRGDGRRQRTREGARREAALGRKITSGAERKRRRAGTWTASRHSG